MMGKILIVKVNYVENMYVKMFIMVSIGMKY